MKRYLLITTLDVSRLTNNREHHVLAHVAPRFEETYVIYRRRCAERGWRALMRDALWPRVTEQRRNGVVFLEVNPLLNHVQGLAMDVAGTYRLEEGGKARAGGVRQWIYRAASSLGIFKDLFTVVFLAWYAWRKAPGKFDVCTAMGPWAAASAWLLKKFGKVRVYAYEDRDYEPGFIPTPLRRRFAAAMEVAGLRRADLRISIGGRLAKLRTEQTRLPVATVTTGVALERFDAPPIRDLDRPVFVYTGNVTFWSGLEMVLKAFPDIRRVSPLARLVIAGEGLPGYSAQLERLAHELKIADSVEFLGRVENQAIPGILARAHIGVATFEPLSLRRYAFPLKVLEYMAAGLPAIGTCDTETEDILRKHDCGLAVEFTSEAFTRAAVSLLSDADRYARMSQHARNAAMQYRWDDLMDREYGLLKSTHATQGRAL